MRSPFRPNRQVDLRPFRHLAVLAVVAIAASSACSRIDAATPSPGTSAGFPVVSTGDSSAPDRVGRFVADCPFSHRSPDDPIVHPHESGHGVSGAHSHDFYGNTTTDAHSTTSSLLDASTTCSSPADLSAYWTPTLLRDDTPVTAEQFAAYYDTAPGIDPATVKALPSGLAMIAGNGASAGIPPNRSIGWTCTRGPDSIATAPSCPVTSRLSLHVTFPDCWDGTHLDSTDHRQHVAYSVSGRCPDTHPVAMTRLVLRIRYPVSGDPGRLSLASGPLATAHADFMNAWTETGLAELMDLCIRRDVDCGEA